MVRKVKFKVGRNDWRIICIGMMLKKEGILFNLRRIVLLNIMIEFELE